MRLRLLALCLVLSLLLAGCATETAPSAASEGATDAVGVPAGATNETLAEFDADLVPHLHDYWQGRERVTLFEGEVTPDAGGEGLDSTLIAAGFGREARVGGVSFRLPDGAIVYEGAGTMEITATPADPTTTSIALAYKPADRAEHSEPVTLEPGQPFLLDLPPEWTDMPHSPTSRWAFFFQPESPGAMLGPFTLRIDVVRTRDVTLFPGHPDLWDGPNATARVLMEGSHRTEKFAYATRGVYLMENGDFGEPEFAPQKTVPMETTLVRVEVHITGTDATAGEVTEARFFFRGADSSQLQSGGEPVEGSWEEKRLVWEVPVTMEMADSPYATESQWRFMVEPATQFTGADPTCGGCVDSALEFDVVITALREVAEAT